MFAPKKGYAAVMLNKQEHPATLFATSEVLLLNEVRNYIKVHADWREAMGVNVAEVDTMSISEMHTKLGDERGPVDEAGWCSGNYAIVSTYYEFNGWDNVHMH